MKAKKMYGGVIVPTALLGAETWDLKPIGRRKVNIFDMWCVCVDGHCGTK